LRRLAATVALVLVAVTAPGCGAVRGLLDTERALKRAGFERVNINVDSNGPVDVVQVQARQSRAHENPNDAVAEVVWTEFPFRFDRLNVFVTSAAPRSYSRADLEARFGARPPGLDDKSLEDSLRRTGIAVLIVLAVAFVGFLVIVVVTIVLVVRAQRKRRAQIQTGPWIPPPGPPGAGGPPFAPPPPG
jgi:hypothetical protein